MVINLLAAVDGTGSASWDSSHTRSIIARFYRAYRPGLGGNKIHFNGEDITGLNADRTIRSVLFWFEIHLRSLGPNDEARICMVGYSRGAVTVINAATRLLAPHNTVNFLGLIDPVDRSIMVDVPAIPINVSAIALARRTPGVDTSWSYSPATIRPGTHSRLYRQEFYTDHAGMGTGPDIRAAGACFDETPPNDGRMSAGAARCDQGSRAVFPWLLDCARREGIPV